MFGGMYGGNCAKNEEELQQAIKSFEEQVARLKENGLERVDIVRHDEVVRVSQPKLTSQPKPEPVEVEEPVLQPTLF